MNRVTSFLALSAIVVAGAFAGTAAQASAGVSVDFKGHNADNSASMIRTSPLGTEISGLINPPAAIGPGGDDPSSGFAVFSAPTPAIGGNVHASVSYANAIDGVSNACTFTITVTRTALAAYTLHLSVGPSGTPCSVPSGPDPTNANGQFTSQAYVLTWKT
jgi:hypothetical protein